MDLLVISLVIGTVVIPLFVAVVASPKEQDAKEEAKNEYWYPASRN